MKKIIYIVVFLSIVFPLNALAIAGDGVRFDFTDTGSTVMDDTSTTCPNTTTIRYDFSDTGSKAMYDTTASCSFLPTPTSSAVYVNNKTFINNQVFIK